MHVECLDFIPASCHKYVIKLIKSSKLRWAGHMARMGLRTDACGCLVGKLEAWRPPGSPRRSWSYNTKINLKQLGWEGVDWIQLAQDIGK